MSALTDMDTPISDLPNALNDFSIDISDKCT